MMAVGGETGDGAWQLTAERPDADLVAVSNGADRIGHSETVTSVFENAR